MLKKNKLLLAAGLLINILPANASRSVFVPRPLTTDLTYELALNNYFIYHPDRCDLGPTCTNIQASYFHQESTKACDFGRYFLPCGKNPIVLAEDGTGDVDSLWLELISAPGTSYRSCVSLRPKRRIDGGYFNFHFDFSRWACGLWFAVSFAAARVEHCLNLRETNSANPGTIPGLANAAQALNNPAWCADKFSCTKLCRTGVDDVQLKLGYDYYWCNNSHTGLYLVGTVPTGRRCDNNFIFDPRLGTRHGSVGVGINTDWGWCCGNQKFNWMLDANYRYVFARCERRSFDLCGRGDWSRFLQVVSNDARSFSQPGINFFTQDVKVTPRSTAQLWTALHYAWCAYNFEVGYNLWWRQCEDICLRSKLCPVGVYDISGECSRNPTSANCTNISQSLVPPNKAQSDAVFTALCNKDLNLRSGAAPKALTNKVYGAFSYNAEPCCIPVMIGVGGAYEFARCHEALNNWSVFLKTGVSF